MKKDLIKNLICSSQRSRDLSDLTVSSPLPYCTLMRSGSFANLIKLRALDHTK